MLLQYTKGMKESSEGRSPLGMQTRLTRRQLLVGAGASLLTSCIKAPEKKPNETLLSRAPSTGDSFVTEQASFSPSLNLLECDPVHMREAREAFIVGYENWKRQFLSSAGKEQLRVISNEEEGTFSEFMGHGMLFSAYRDDKPTFEGLWKYAQQHTNTDGLMSWNVDALGSPNSNSSAADADIDIAQALLVADKRWGGYSDEAGELITTIMDHDVEPDTFILKGGNDWGGSSGTNSSYYSPLSYEEFAVHTGDTRWKNVAQKSWEVIDAVKEARHTRTGLPPDWTLPNGEPLLSVGPTTHYYGYEAIRVPLRQAEAALVSRDDAVRVHAVKQMMKVNAFFETIDPDYMKDGYDIRTGKTVGKYYEVPAFISTTAVASLVSSREEYRQRLHEKTIRQVSKQVYNETIRLRALLLLSGLMKE